MNKETLKKAKKDVRQPSVEKIRTRAYEIWLRESRPDGRHEEHWRIAEQELLTEH